MNSIVIATRCHAKRWPLIIAGDNWNSDCFNRTILPSPRALIFFLFLALLGGGFLLFLNANRNYQRPAPSSAVWSPPNRPIKIVTFNIHHSPHGNRAVLDQLATLNPDF